MRKIFYRASADKLLSSTAVVFDVILKMEESACEHANQTSSEAPWDSRGSTASAPLRPSEDGGGRWAEGVLGRPPDPQILALLLWIDGRYQSGRGALSVRSLADGPFSCPVILFLPDGSDAAATGRFDLMPF